MRKNFVYTQTRLQARHGARPDERTWTLLESQKDLANYLQAARQTRAGYWLSGLQATDSHHFIEQTLLKHYRDYVIEVAAWTPSKWRKSVIWVVCLTYLPVIQHLLKGNTGYSWMLDDPQTKLLTTTNLEQRTGYLLQSDFSPLFKYLKSNGSLVDAWLAHWRKLLPENKQRSLDPFESFINFILGHREHFGQLPLDRTWAQRQKLNFKLTMMFRRQAYHPVNVFIHLLLVALDIERLRGAIMQRCLFENYQELTA